MGGQGVLVARAYMYVVSSARVELVHALMSAVIGLEIRAAGSRRGQPHSPKVHAKAKDEATWNSQPTPLHTILGK
jgi:hypothetical protein